MEHEFYGRSGRGRDGGRGRRGYMMRGPGDHPRRQRGEGFGGGRGRGRGRRRLFDYGELRLLILSMIAETPRHGYELIKAVEAESGGAYVPSPGVIYPTLSWLEDMGYAVPEEAANGRKLFAVTEEGKAFLAENATEIAALKDRFVAEKSSPQPIAIMRALENLNSAVRLRLQYSEVDQAAIEAMVKAIDEAANKVERA